MQSHMEHAERKLPRPITIDDLNKPKSKDEIRVQYDEDWTALRSGRAGHPIYVYNVQNLTNGHEYTVEIQEDEKGQPYAWDNCAAGVVCKHHLAVLADVRQKLPDFGRLIYGAAGDADTTETEA